jgi:hypothetical protein
MVVQDIGIACLDELACGREAAEHLLASTKAQLAVYYELFAGSH